MTLREELDEAVARAMMDAYFARPGAFDSQRFATEKPSYIKRAKTANDAALSHFEATGWQLVPKTVNCAMDDLLKPGSWPKILAAAPAPFVEADDVR